MTHYRTRDLRGFLRIGIVPALAAVAGVLLMASLGNWQTRRAEGKIALQERVSAAVRATPVDLSYDSVRSLPAGELGYRHVRLTGTWQPEATIYLDNRTHAGQAGMYVIMPLQVRSADGPDGKAQDVLVNRGWLPRDARERTRIAPYETPAGQVVIEGVVLGNEPRLLELGTAPAPALRTLWQNLDFDAWQRASGRPPVRWVVRQDPGAPRDGLVRDWPEAGAGLDEQIGKHRGYALQWYGLAALLAGLAVFFELRKRRASVRSAPPVDSANPASPASPADRADSSSSPKP